MSAHLQWMIVRNCSSFLIKRNNQTYSTVSTGPGHPRGERDLGGTPETPPSLEGKGIGLGGHPPRDTPGGEAPWDRPRDTPAPCGGTIGIGGPPQ
uniref:Uncharacterized protein n=1 Tax=Falco tinnunculus TaxID=100819 RepID=A0A8C4U0F0_FALTI